MNQSGRRFFGVTLCAAILASPTSSFGMQTVCAKVDDLAAGLQVTYHEAPVATASGGADHLVALFVAPDGKTWTLVVVTQEGVACTLDSGTDWHILPAASAETISRADAQPNNGAGSAQDWRQHR